MIAAVAQIDLFQQIIDALVESPPRKEGRQGHVFRDGERRDQPKVLKDKTDLFASQMRSFLLSQMLNGPAKELKCSRSWCVHAAEEIEQRRFAGARRADDRNEFAALQLERNVVECFYLLRGPVYTFCSSRRPRSPHRSVAAERVIPILHLRESRPLAETRAARQAGRKPARLPSAMAHNRQTTTFHPSK